MLDYENAQWIKKNNQALVPSDFKRLDQFEVPDDQIPLTTLRFASMIESLKESEAFKITLLNFLQCNSAYTNLKKKLLLGAERKLVTRPYEIISRFDIDHNTYSIYIYPTNHGYVGFASRRMQRVRRIVKQIEVVEEEEVELRKSAER